MPPPTSTNKQDTSSPLPLPPGYTLHQGFPSVPEYLHLRAAAGLSPKTPAQATAVARGSWFGCYVTHDKEEGIARPVAMGRIIGDGGWYFHIADMAVLPEYQRRGLGDVILKTLLNKIKEGAPRDGIGKPYVTLFADEAGRRLYQKNGFVESAPKEVGMAMLMDLESEGLYSQANEEEIVRER